MRRAARRGAGAGARRARARRPPRTPSRDAPPGGRRRLVQRRAAARAGPLPRHDPAPGERLYYAFDVKAGPAAAHRRRDRPDDGEHVPDGRLVRRRHRVRRCATAASTPTRTSAGHGGCVFNTDRQDRAPDHAGRHGGGGRPGQRSDGYGGPGAWFVTADAALERQHAPTADRGAGRARRRGRGPRRRPEPRPTAHARARPPTPAPEKRAERGGTWAAGLLIAALAGLLAGWRSRRSRAGARAPPGLRSRAQARPAGGTRSPRKSWVSRPLLGARGRWHRGRHARLGSRSDSSPSQRRCRPSPPGAAARDYSGAVDVPKGYVTVRADGCPTSGRRAFRGMGDDQDRRRACARRRSADPRSEAHAAGARRRSPREPNARDASTAACPRRAPVIESTDGKVKSRRSTSRAPRRPTA